MAGNRSATAVGVAGTMVRRCRGVVPPQRPPGGPTAAVLAAEMAPLLSSLAANHRLALRHEPGLPVRQRRAGRAARATPALALTIRTTKSARHNRGLEQRLAYGSGGTRLPSCALLFLYAHAPIAVRSKLFGVGLSDFGRIHRLRRSPDRGVRRSP